MIEIKEAIEVVEKLNNEIYNFFKKDYGEPFSMLDLCTDGNSIIINFLKIYRIWPPDEDEREYFDDKDEYEPIEQFLRKEIQKIIGQLSQIKLLNLKEK